MPVPVPPARSWAGAHPNLQPALLSSWHLWGSSQQLSWVSRQHWRGMEEAPASCQMQALRCEGGLAWEPAGVSPMWEPCFWLRMPKDSSRHGAGAGRYVQGLGSAYEFLWDRKVAVGEGVESGWTWLGVRVCGTSMERGDQDMLCPEVWPEAGPWSLLFEVSAVSLHLGTYCCQWWHSKKLTLGTSDLGRRLPPGGPEPKPPSSRNPSDVRKLRIWLCAEMGLNSAKRRVSYLFWSPRSTSGCLYTSLLRATANLFSEAGELCLHFLLLLGRQESTVTSRARRWGWQQGSCLSAWILLRIIVVARGDWQNSEDVTIEATTCRTQQ